MRYRRRGGPALFVHMRKHGSEPTSILVDLHCAGITNSAPSLAGRDGCSQIRRSLRLGDDLIAVHREMMRFFLQCRTGCRIPLVRRFPLRPTRAALGWKKSNIRISEKRVADLTKET